MPRILGYAFNPLSVYFCHGADGGLQAIIYEVNNTFGERHSYLIAVDAGERDSGGSSSAAARCSTSRRSFRSTCGYAFRVDPPHPERAALSIGIAVHDRVGTIATRASMRAGVASTTGRWRASSSATRC